MSGKLEHFMWAKGEAEFDAMRKLGWVEAEQRRTHHHYWATLMKWGKPGEPALPVRGK